MKVYHSIKTSSLQDALQYGLTYGSSGVHSRKQHAEKTNTYLDDHRPAFAVAEKISRSNCLYMYATFGNLVLDVKDGHCLLATEWSPGQDCSKLLVEIPHEHSYVSDLDAYDALADALQQNQPDDEVCQQLAAQYWQRVVPLSHFMQAYDVADYRLARNQRAIAVPDDLRRIEIMVAASIPASAVSQPKHNP